jgi:hypothetical protein
MHRHGGATRSVARLALALAGFFFAVTLGAQTIIVPRSDLSLPPSGTLRIGIRGEFFGADELRDDDGLAPLASRFDFGQRRVRASASASITRVPITLEYGLVRWLSVGVTIPLVRRQVTVAVDTLARVAGDTAMRRIDLEAVATSGTFTHTNLGDVEATLTIGAWQSAAPSRGLGARAAVAVTGRIATGQERPLNNYFDPGSGDGQPDVEVAAGVQLGFGRRLAAGVIATHTLQQRDEQSLIVADTMFPAARVVAGVARDLGDITTVTVAPRYTLTRFLDFVAGGRWVRKGEDSYDGAVPDPAWGLIALPRESFDETRVTLGFDFSTRSSQHGTIGSWPLDMTLRYEWPVASSGARLPVVRTAVVGGRLYARF